MSIFSGFAVVLVAGVAALGIAAIVALVLLLVRGRGVADRADQSVES